MKTLKFAGSALADIRGFPAAARRDAGYQLSQVQMGFEPVDWRSMTNVYPGVREIRIHKEGEFRVIYMTKRHDALYVLHAFQKKTHKTSKKDIALAKAHLKVVLQV